MVGQEVPSEEGDEEQSGGESQGPPSSPGETGSGQALEGLDRRGGIVGRGACQQRDGDIHDPPAGLYGQGHLTSPNSSPIVVTALKTGADAERL